MNIILPAILAGAPVYYELDFDALPPPGTIKRYEFSILYQIVGHEDQEDSMSLNVTSSPDSAATFFMPESESLWRMKREGNRVIVYSYNGCRIVAVNAVGVQGPKPGVRRVLAKVPEKKPAPKAAAEHEKK
jgi:hypothetical protein